MGGSVYAGSSSGSCFAGLQVLGFDPHLAVEDERAVQPCSLDVAKELAKVSLLRLRYLLDDRWVRHYEQGRRLWPVFIPKHSHPSSADSMCAWRSWLAERKVGYMRTFGALPSVSGTRK